MDRKCKICKKGIEKHEEGDLLICAAEEKILKGEEDAARREKGYDTDSIDGGVFTFDC